jgi:chromosome partitioning protein
MVHTRVPLPMAQTQTNTQPKDAKAEPRAVSFTFLKGGSSKTTLAINTARHLTERNGEGSTLFIDFDPNGHATTNYDYGYDDLYERSTDLDRVLLGDEADFPPEELALSTQFGFDIIPSADDLENVKNGLTAEMGGSSRLRTRVVAPLLEDGSYDYIIIDPPSNKGMMNNNSAFASRNLIFPMLPRAETIESFRRTRDRLITPLEERNLDVNILALVPNGLGQRIDQQTNDRELLESLNTNPNLKDLVPEFARITEEEWEKIDAGEMKPPKPGIREAESITNGMKNAGLPLLDYEPDHPQTENFDELAAIVERGGV